MRDKVPPKSSTGTGQGDVVRKGNSAKRQSLSRAMTSLVLLSLLLPAILYGAVTIQSADLPNPVVPSGRVTQLHGQYPSTLGRNTHIGIDLAASESAATCDENTPAGQRVAVHAFADGIVKAVALDPGWSKVTGNALMLEHSAAGEFKFYTTYLHLASPPQDAEGHPLSVGTEKPVRVTKGQLIGYMGSTGAAEGCHVHFEVKLKPEWGGQWRIADAVPDAERDRQNLRINIYGLGDVRLGMYRENWENFANNWINPLWLFCTYPAGMNEGDPLVGGCDYYMDHLTKGDEIIVNDDPVNVWSNVDPKTGTPMKASKGARGIIGCPQGYEHCDPVFDGHWYWFVKLGSGQEGWIAEKYFDPGLRLAGGCGCTFMSGQDYDKWPNTPLLVSDQSCQVRMNLNGMLATLRAKGRYIDPATGQGDESCRAYPEYVGAGLNVHIEFEEAGRCPPTSTECEVTYYRATVSIEREGKTQVLEVQGDCGC